MSDDDSAADAVLPDGVERRTPGGHERLSTRDEPVYGESVDSDDWCMQDTGRSKLGVMLEPGTDTGLVGSRSVLHLGATSGTTVSHVADFVGSAYAVEFVPRPVRDLVGVAEGCDNLFPLLKDVHDPDSYAHAVETGIDCLVMSMATRGQATVVIRNRQFLVDDDRFLIAAKARSEDMTAEPDDALNDVIAKLDSTYEPLETTRLDRFHADHLGIVARPKQAIAAG